MKTVAVYGSAVVRPGEPEYQDAYEIGRALAQAGYAIMTGGYGGIMGAASQGAAEAGGHVIGVTSRAIELLRDDQANAWVSEEIKYDTLRDRLLHLVLHADACVVMPGGLGTLNELALSWELGRVGDLPLRPLVCYGDFWRQMLEPLRGTRYMAPYAWEMVSFADHPGDVVALVNGTKVARQ
ncbi:MAG: LOG family protein [Phototrophicaceae bacterium]